MNISQIKEYLGTVDTPVFVLPTGQLVPAHYHITEIGLVNKEYIDCGGQMRSKKCVSFQIWTADDTDHRLSSTKLLDIISVFQTKISSDEVVVEVEYQLDTIGTYLLQRHEHGLLLVPTATDCLAKEACGIPEVGAACCGGGCC